MALTRELFLAHFDERTLPDGCIRPTDVAGWSRVLDALRASPWRLENDPGPDVDLEVLFNPEAERLTIKVLAGPGPVQVNVFLLEPTSIDFDFATAEMVDQDAVELLAEFIRLVSQATQASCELTPEGFGTDVVARHGPTADRFAVLGDGQGSLDEAVWNRAALYGGGGEPRSGDLALASVLLAHGLISNGGVAHAVMDAPGWSGD